MTTTRVVSCIAAAFALTACGRRERAPDALPTATPIKHLVVIFGENISFDHYFGTYPVAANPRGEPAFTAAPGTPAVNGLSPALLAHNPNAANAQNGSMASNPFRLDRTQAATSDQSHDYTEEQLAYDGGAADLFPKYTGAGLGGGTTAFYTPAVVMGYYDGNTVTALWNYAQHFAMSDAAYGDVYGPSAPGAISLVSGQTNGWVVDTAADSTSWVHDGRGGFTLISDAGPSLDICAESLLYINRGRMTGKNVGDALSAAGVTWGWFQGGFDLGTAIAGRKGCSRMTKSAVALQASPDYIPHHEPFQYYRSTANPRHLRPSSPAAIGHSGDAANHQYDLRDFFTAVREGNFPAVAFLKAPAYQDGHAGYSDPLDEQRFLAEIVNFIEESPEWPRTAIVVLYDDSDGWYDHQTAPVGNASFDPARDRLNGSGACGVRGTTPQLGGVTGAGPVNGRCGPGTRQPFLVISPWARPNYVDHTPITQSSVLRFIEDNWLGGRRLGGGSFDATAGPITGLFDFAGQGKTPRLFLDDSLGTPVAAPANRLPE